MILKAVNAGKNFIRKRNDSNVFCAVAKTNLELPEGTLTVLSGPSGSGKSTLLNMFAGLLPPTEGQILLDESDLYQKDDRELSEIRNRHIGVIPQGQTALQALTVLENVLVPYSLYHGGRMDKNPEILDRARTLLEKADIRNLEQEMPSRLSGGELRRMAVCRALLMSPQIILADEPTGDLDEENTDIVMGMLKDCTRSGGTVLVVTHDRQVLSFADKCLEMKKGILNQQVNF